MSQIIVKDALGDNKYFGTHGTGAVGDPYFSIPADFYTEVRKGNVPKHSIVQKFGAISNVTTTLTPVTTSGKYPTPLITVPLEVVSDDNVNDKAGGAGALTITIEGISNTNGPWTREVQTVALNGTTPVVLPNNMLRVDRMYVASSGAYATAIIPSHNSVISVREVSGGAIWQTLFPTGSFGLAQSEIAVYTIAKGTTGYFLGKSVYLEDTKTANIFLFVRDGADVVTAPFAPMRVKELERNLRVNATRTPNAPLLKITGPADVGFIAQSTSTTTSVSIEFELLLVED